MIALLLLLLAACPAPPEGDDDDSAPSVASRAVLLYGAYTGDATVATSNLDGGDIDDDLLGLAGSDWVVASAGGDPWLIGRFGADVVRRYEGTSFGAPSVEFSVGSPSNPQSLALCAGRLFVSRLGLLQDGGGGDLAVYDPETGSPLGTVDLSAYDEGTDGSPEPHAIVQRGGTLYVGLQRLDTTGLVWEPDPVGRVVAIDCASAEVVDSWDTGPNPFLSAWAGDRFRLLVKTDDDVVAIDPADGGVETIWDAAAAGETLDGAAASGDVALFVASNEDRTRSVVRCWDGGEVADLEESTSWGLSLTTAPDGAIWGVWRDHWATPDADAHGFARYDPASCSALGPWLTFASEPLDVAFVP
jgi:hypothetical protein